MTAVDLLNETPYAARVLGHRPSEEADVVSALIVKATFERNQGGRWTPAPQQLPIIDDKLETPYGVFHTDCFMRKEGVDICVLGTARMDRPVRQAPIEVAVGTHRCGLLLFGDRRWIRAGRQLVPSAPLPFQEMPIAYSRAYGGTTEHDYETVVHPDNPVGRGYYLSPEKAEDQPLANIESPADPPVRQWTDRPSPAGWAPYPCMWGIRAREGVEPPAEPQPGTIGRVKARLNNNAHPALILPAVEPEAEVRIRGLRGGEMVFPVPPLQLTAEVALNDARFEARGAPVDGIFVWADSQRITLTRRFHFSYPYQRRQRRNVRLRWTGPSGGL